MTIRFYLYFRWKSRHTDYRIQRADRRSTGTPLARILGDAAFLCSGLQLDHYPLDVHGYLHPCRTRIRDLRMRNPWIITSPDLDSPEEEAPEDWTSVASDFSITTGVDLKGTKLVDRQTLPGLLVYPASQGYRTSRPPGTPRSTSFVTPTPLENPSRSDI